MLHSVAYLEVEYALPHFQPDISKIMEKQDQDANVDKPVMSDGKNTVSWFWQWG